MTEPGSLLVRVRAFTSSAFRLALALALAFILTGVIVAAGYWGWTAQDRAQAQQAEKVRMWAKDLKTHLSMTLQAKTKLVDHTMYVSLEFDGYPDYLKHPWNQSRGFTIKWEDADGFSQVEKFVKLSEFSTRVDNKDKPGGLFLQFTSFATPKNYNNLANISVEWTIDTSAPKPAPIVVPRPPEVGKDTSDSDHCAPGLTRQERMRRLAKHGQVRETGMGEFTVGSKRLFYIGGELYSCR